MRPLAQPTGYGIVRTATVLHRRLISRLWIAGLEESANLVMLKPSGTPLTGEEPDAASSSPPHDVAIRTLQPPKNRLPMRNEPPAHAARSACSKAALSKLEAALAVAYPDRLRHPVN